MVREKNLFEFNRSIKLSPAIGDWTAIQYEETDLNELSVSSVQNVNFDSLPKEQLKYVHYLHYRLAEKMTKKLSQDMDIKVELHSIEVMQMSYEDFLQMNHDKVVQTNFRFKNNSKVNVLFDWPLAEMVIDRLAGGRGESQDSDEFSDIEASILETQMEEIKPLFVDSWKVIHNDSIDVEFSFGQYVQDKKVTLREAYIIFAFNFFFGKNDLKKIIIAYPNMILRTLLSQRKKLADELKQRIELETATAENIMIPVRATLGKAILPMSALKTLSTGDIIPLNANLNSPISIHFGDATVIAGQPGSHNGKTCIQIIQDSRSTALKNLEDMKLTSINQPLFENSMDEAEKLVETIELQDTEDDSLYEQEKAEEYPLEDIGTDKDDQYITTSKEVDAEDQEWGVENEEDYAEDDDIEHDTTEDRSEDDDEDYGEEDQEESDTEEDQDEFSWDDLDK